MEIQSKMKMQPQDDAVNYYEFVDETIVSTLEMSLDPIEESLLSFYDKKLLLNWKQLDEFIQDDVFTNSQGQEFLSMEVLVTLADQCDEFLFSKHCLELPKPIRGLLEIINQDGNKNQEERNYIATLIALNMVESSIRNITSKKHGRAPLLKDMIASIAERNDLPDVLAKLLASLLLPKGGLNLRNLLWHGFLSRIKRRWLALSILIVLSIDDLSASTSFEEQVYSDLAPLENLRKNEALKNIILHGEAIVSSKSNMTLLEEKLLSSSLIPSSHKQLFQTTLTYKDQPVLFASIIAPFVENSLRIIWCNVNNERNQLKATPDSYYATLDGHGQRDKHDVILLPYLTTDGEVDRGKPNALVAVLGAPTMALLVDLFASPQGPNIRATIAHGIYNQYLFRELEYLQSETDPKEKTIVSDTPQPLNDLVYSLVALMDILGTDPLTSTSSKLIKSYRPTYSYTAMLKTEIKNAMRSFEEFHSIFTKCEYKVYLSSSSKSPSNQHKLEESLSKLAKNHQDLKSIQERINIKLLRMTTNEWSANDLYHEYECNIALANCGAVKLLFGELSIAMQVTLQEIQQLDELIDPEKLTKSLSSRKRKQIERKASIAQLIFDFYSICLYFGLIFVEVQLLKVYNEEISSMSNVSEDMLALGVKRSRMVVSTFSSSAMVDRGLNAVEQYIKGKAVKALCVITIE
ncbi:hypothetical protein CTEN210_13051 [Chaetoceros tenuissimus]|uniref:DUF4209 domain-containing protein n=1 Tax=Chaetoceros tenuissimus TaxID=426638 RepID=A0AAD3D4U8_9STRA|nr:hypothetical protein CTEN210_13051 [Chaetoceros tenuissimus]